jgi:hypothetical protein
LDCKNKNTCEGAERLDGNFTHNGLRLLLIFIVRDMGEDARRLQIGMRTRKKGTNPHCKESTLNSVFMLSAEFSANHSSTIFRAVLTILESLGFPKPGEYG